MYADGDKIDQSLFGPLLHVETLFQRAFYRNGDTYRQQDLVTANFGERVDRPFHFTHHVGNQRGFLFAFAAFEQHDKAHEIELVTVDHVVFFELLLNQVQLVLSYFRITEIECLCTVPSLGRITGPVFGMFDPEIGERSRIAR